MAIQLTEKNIKLSIAEGAHAYQRLRKEVMTKKILDRAYLYYTVLLFGVTTALIELSCLLYQATQPLLVIGLSFVLALVTAQVMGIVHDAGHRAIAKSVFINNIIGHIYAFVLATLFEQWRPSHDRHHAHTNEHDEDPDINIPLLSFTVERAKEKVGWQKLAVPYQALIYFPLGSFVWLSMRLNNVKYLRKKQITFAWIVELITWLISIVIWFVLPFLLFPLWKALSTILIVNFTLGLYALHVFAPNHKGMPEVARDTRISFFEQQIVTSRNVTTHPIVDFLYLGLNYQIEHHLFPNCPRINMPRLAKIVRKVCKEYTLPYEECDPLQVDKIILNELARVSQQLKVSSG